MSINPDDGHEEIDNTDEKALVDRIIAESFEPQLVDSTAAQLAAQFVPADPADHAIAHTFTKPVDRARAVTEWVRLWLPLLIATGLYAAFLTFGPVTAPLATYGAALVGFAWWVSAGRPGPILTIRLIGAGMRTLAHLIGRVLAPVAGVASLILRAALHATRSAASRVTSSRVRINPVRTATN